MNRATQALRDALGTPIDNGPTYPRVQVRQPRSKEGFGPIKQARPPMGWWRCDDASCNHAKGWGLQALKRHFELTGHTTVTSTEWQGMS